jgi:uncharacterized protein YjbI with pentapeptide repeats
LEGANLRGSIINKETQLDEKWRRVWEIVNPPQANRNRDLNKSDLSFANLQEADLSKAHLEEAHLEGADLSKAHLEEAHLEGAHLKRANFWEAHLKGADLEGAHLEGADLEGADLGFANLEGANLAATYLKEAKGLTVEQVKSAINWELAYYDDEFRQQLGL